MMKRNIKVVFKDGMQRAFDADIVDFNKYGFCDLELNEKDGSIVVACVSTDEIKYLRFVEVKDEKV